MEHLFKSYFESSCFVLLIGLFCCLLCLDNVTICMNVRQWFIMCIDLDDNCVLFLYFHSIYVVLIYIVYLHVCHVCECMFLSLQTYLYGILFL